MLPIAVSDGWASIIRRLSVFTRSISSLQPVTHVPDTVHELGRQISSCFNGCDLSIIHHIQWLTAVTCSVSLSSFLACNSYDCVAPYVDIILHRGQFWAKTAASGSVRWCCFRSCWTVLSHVMWGWPSCLLQSAGGEANKILLASALSSMHIICPNKVSRHDWIIAVSLGCFVSLRRSSFRTNW